MMGAMSNKVDTNQSEIHPSMHEIIASASAQHEHVMAMSG